MSYIGYYQCIFIGDFFMNNETKYTVKICDDYVITDPNKTKEILEKVSKVISNAHKRISNPPSPIR